MQNFRYKAIKMAKTAATWRSMATICIRHKRLDVAEVCLGYMGNILGVRAIRESAGVAEADARLAAAAVHLGMIDEAERLYRGCGRYDLLNKLYISQGRMDKALETSQSRDRLHMRTILFHNARHKESCGDLDGSIKAYEQAGVHCKEVPRMLWEKKEKARLEECDAPSPPLPSLCCHLTACGWRRYCKSSSDPQLTKWWAQYCESQGRFDDALAVYVQSNDIAAQVTALASPRVGYSFVVTLRCRSRCCLARTTLRRPRSLRWTAAMRWRAFTWPSSWSTRSRCRRFVHLRFQMPAV
jgi:intraflagellar transport protein 140